MSQGKTLIGSVVHGFQVTRRLGEGGMGDVYLGRHREIESLVAIKVLHPELVSDPIMERRFLDEARAVNRVEHPSLVRIHDCGREEDVGVFLVMEFLRGDTLRQRLKADGPMAPEDAVRILVQLTSALTAVHAEGVVHRDLKPENIMLVADPLVPGGERVKILDFGIAKLKEGETSSSHTKTGAVFGTPLYMSPEQCQDAKSVDPRSDIYSLGAMGYEMLCGQPPYRAESIYGLVRKHLTEKPTALSKRNPAVPVALDQVIVEALAVLADERFATASALGDALARAIKEPSRQRTLDWGAEPAEAPDTGSVSEKGRTIPSAEASRKPRVLTQDTTDPPPRAARTRPRGAAHHTGPEATDPTLHQGSPKPDVALAATDMAPALSLTGDEAPMEPQDSLASAEVSRPSESEPATPKWGPLHKVAVAVGLVMVVGGIVLVGALKQGGQHQAAAPGAQVPVSGKQAPATSSPQLKTGAPAAPPRDQARAVMETVVVETPSTPDAGVKGQPAPQRKPRATRRRRLKKAVRKKPRPAVPATPGKKPPAPAAPPDDDLRVRKLKPVHKRNPPEADDLRVRKLRPRGPQTKKP